MAGGAPSRRGAPLSPGAGEGFARRPPLGNAAKAKLVGPLSARLKGEGVYIGEVTIAGVVEGTGPDSAGMPTIEGAAIADTFWRLYKARDEIRARIG